jgi:hypothetical protein
MGVCLACLKHKLCRLTVHQITVPTRERLTRLSKDRTRAINPAIRVIPVICRAIFPARTRSRRAIPSPLKWLGKMRMEILKLPMRIMATNRKAAG